MTKHLSADGRALSRNDLYSTSSLKKRIFVVLAIFCVVLFVLTMSLIPHHNFQWWPYKPTPHSDLMACFTNYVIKLNGLKVDQNSRSVSIDWQKIRLISKQCIYTTTIFLTLILKHCKTFNNKLILRGIPEIFENGSTTSPSIIDSNFLYTSWFCLYNSFFTSCSIEFVWILGRQRFVAIIILEEYPLSTEHLHPKYEKRLSSSILIKEELSIIPSTLWRSHGPLQLKAVLTTAVFNGKNSTFWHKFLYKMTPNIFLIILSE
uniref:Glyco_tran_10_N domain-containing protein n=1 Tax=Heterorhabditis bacteriophora TaxID=37862 RepID=A0A1I7WXJ8_HETBA